MGIEPTRSAWKAEVLPLNYICLFCSPVVYHIVLILSNCSLLHLTIRELCVDLLRDHGGADLAIEFLLDLERLRILRAGSLERYQPRPNELRRLRDIEHRAFGNGDDRTVDGEFQLKLLDRTLKVMLGVRIAAAAHHHIAEL